MQMENEILWVFFLLVGFNIVCCVNDVCTRVDADMAMHCAVLLPNVLTMGSIGYDKIRQDVCKSGGSYVDVMTNCVENIRSTNNCSEDEGFEQYIKTSDYLAAIGYFCNYSAEHDEAILCISAGYMSGDVQFCSQEALLRLQYMDRMGLMTTVQEFMVETCSYIRARTQCLADWIKNSCRQTTGQFVDNFYKHHFGVCYAAETRCTSEVTTGHAQESTKTTFGQTTHSGSKSGVLHYTILMLLLPIINIID